jgi:hypothetical protein
MTTTESAMTSPMDDISIDPGIELIETGSGARRSRALVITPMALLGLVGIGVLVWMLMRRRSA